MPPPRPRSDSRHPHLRVPEERRHRDQAGRITKSLLEIGTVGLVCAAVIWLYAWIANPAISQFGNTKPEDALYNLLVAGFRDGHVSLKKEIPAGFLQLPDPYDPNANRPFRVEDGMHDLSYYRQKLYLYFGVTPALVLFWPFVAVTGRYLFHNQAVAIFCAAGFVLGAALLIGIRRRYFPRVGTGRLVMGVLAIGLATGVPIMLRRPDVWEVPIACAQALTFLAFAAIWRALHAAKSRDLWLALASAAYGLALGARPSLAFGAVILLVPLTQAWKTPSSGERRRGMARLRSLIAAIVPIAAIGIALLAYNHARFGNPLEFGQNYQLTGRVERAGQRFGFDFVWFNLWVYFFAPAHWDVYFPFVRGFALPVPPAGQLGVENPFGVLVNVPLVWLACAVPLVGRIVPAGEGAPLRAFLWAMCLFFAATALTLLCYGGAVSRYEVEFLTPLVLLAVIGAWTLEGSLATRAVGRRVAAVTVGLLFAFSIAFNLCASCAYWDLFRLQNPRDYRTLAHALDFPAWWAEKLAHTPTGPVELRLRLPPFSGPRNETLVATGFPPNADYLLIRYDSADTIILGFVHTDHGGSVSERLPVDYAREHTLAVHFGSFYPPADHPFFDRFRAEETIARVQGLRVELDGREVLSGRTRFYDASPLMRHLAPNPVPFANAPAAGFTGRILSSRPLEP